MDVTPGQQRTRNGHKDTYAGYPTVGLLAAFCRSKSV